MTGYATLPPEVREVAERVLTPAQLDVFTRKADGQGDMEIARALLLTRSAVRDRLHNATTKLLKEGWRVDASGNWYREVAA